ncbi:MAG: recombinase family protein [Christensenellales bacterium]|jgi:site-specific DNA recombinase
MDIIKLRNALSAGSSIFDLPLKVAYYARVSTDKDEQRGSLGNQIEYYERMIRENPNWTFANGYVDEGISGTGVLARRSFLRMIEDAKSGVFDLLITKEISRFSRNTLDSIRYTQELLRHGVGVYFQSDNINTLLPDSELRLTIMAGIAQDEVRKLSERVSFGIKRAREKGRVLGAAPTGYIKRDGKLMVDESEAEMVQRAFELYAAGGIGIRKLSEALFKEGFKNAKGGPLSYHTLRGILSNPKYKGCYCGNKTTKVDFRDKKSVRLPREEWIEHPDENVPALVSEELWERANALLEKRGDAIRENAQACGTRYPYSGKIICKNHQTAFHRQLRRTASGERECWSCRKYRLYGEKGCSAPTLYTDELNRVVTAAVKQVFANREEIIGGLMELYTSLSPENELSKRIAEQEAELKKLVKKRDKLLELAVEGLIDKAEFAKRNAEMTAQVEDAESNLSGLRDDLTRCSQREQRLNRLKRALNAAWDETGWDASVAAAALTRIELTETDTAARLDIYLSMGRLFSVDLGESRSVISLCERGISQAQVSRLEKSALNHMQKYV